MKLIIHISKKHKTISEKELRKLVIRVIKKSETKTTPTDLQQS